MTRKELLQIIERAAREKASELDLTDNGLTALPPEIGQLTELRKLDLGSSGEPVVGEYVEFHGHILSNDESSDDNQLTTLPPEIGQLAKLTFLGLCDNNLKSLPREIQNLRNLKQLDLRGNGSLGIPPEVLKQEPPKILAYYFKTRAEETRPLNQAKILIVGEGGVGKTALALRLLYDEYDEEKLQKTKGININPWKMAGNSDSGPIRVNVWDFGGQEIMHHTHRFFLTKRSLYLLVLDARAGGNERHVHHWMQMIQSYGADSPVLVILNKCDEYYRGLNERGIEQDYPSNVKGFFKISCKEALGLAVLKKTIKKEIATLPHVRDKLPVSYFDVKNKLEARAVEEDVLKFTEYENLCRKHNLERHDIDLLIGFLHDLGTVLHFADEGEEGTILRSENILNPRWVTNGVYRILNNDGLAQAKGVLQRRQLDEILNDPRYPFERRQFILEMMRKFELCFEFPRSKGKRWLIPELLQENQPDLNWDPTKSLNFEYRYEVLPTGLIPQFIVRMHHNLTDKPTFWRSGVVLDIDSNKVLVLGDSRKERVFVSVAGPEKRRRAALSAVRDCFKAIHSSFHKKPIEMVPAPDDPNLAIPHDDLLKMEEDRIEVCWPRGAEHRYFVSELLEGVRDESPARVDCPRKVFLSHTSEFGEYPIGNSFVRAAERAVTRAGDALSNMKYFTARKTKPAEYCKQQVWACDIYVGIVGLRFGSSVRDCTELSYTELEFEAATEAGLQRFVFLLDDKTPVPPARFIDPENWESQQAFRTRLQDSGLTTQMFDSPAKLEILVYQALVDSRR